MGNLQIVRENEKISQIKIGVDTCIRIINSEKGWMAQINQVEHIGGGAVRYHPEGEKIGVSRFINLNDGAKKIYALFS